MIASFRCSPKVKEKIDALVAAGLYTDFSSFCLTALENQLLLEETHRVGGDGQQTLGPGIRIPEPMSPGKPYRKGKGTRDRHTERTSTWPVVPSAPLTSPLAEEPEAEAIGGHESEVSPPPIVPADLRLARLKDKPPFSLPALFADVFQAEQEVPVERWLFGQYNRLLPAKVSIRALAVISSEGKNSLMLGAVAPRIAEIAARFGDYLRALDRRFATHRDDALATAFPERSVEGQKGRVRYQNHFVGHTVKGEQGGILVGLKLAAIQVVKNKPHIFPTTGGWEFARLPNPVLDAPVERAPERLSEQEIAFLLQHIREHVPIELFAYRLILTLITEGRKSPELLTQGLGRYLMPGKKAEDGQDFISTQKNGALGRLIDLDLLSRERQGTRLTYQLTQRGRGLLEEVGAIRVAA